MRTIKKVFGWFFLFIGCVEIDSLPFSAAYHLAEYYSLELLKGKSQKSRIKKFVKKNE